MESKQLLLRVKEQCVPHEYEVSTIKLFVKTGTGTIEVLDSTYIDITTTEQIELAVFAQDTLLGTSSLKLLKCNEPFTEWVVFTLSNMFSVEKPTGEFRFLLEGRVEQQLGPATAKSKYLSNLQATEALCEGVTHSLWQLNEELGESYTRIISESVRLRSPTKKMTPNKGKRSSYGRSIDANFTPEEETVLEVPSSEDRTFHNVCSEDKPVLVYLLLGLSGQMELANAIRTRTIEYSEFTEANNEGITGIDQSLEDSEFELKEQEARVGSFSEMTTNEVIADSENSKSMEKRIKTSLFIKEGLDQVLRKLNEKADYERDDLESLQNEMAFLSGELLKNNMENEEITQETTRKNQIYRETMENTKNAQMTLIEEQRDILTKINAEDTALKHAESVKSQLRNRVKHGEGTLKFQTELRENLASQQTQCEAHKSSATSLSSSHSTMKHELSQESSQTDQFIHLLSKELDLLTQSHNDSKRVLAALVSSQALQLEAQEAHNCCTKDLTMLQSHLSPRELSYKKVSSLFDSTAISLQNSLSELLYLSDCTLKHSESNNSGSLLCNHIRFILQERENETQLLKLTISELKHKFPVYSPSKNDALDKALASFLNQRDNILLVPFVRLQKGLYCFGTKQVLIKLDRNKLQAKVGGGFLPLEHFIQSYESVQKERLQVKTRGYSQNSRRFMGKWAGTIIDKRRGSPEQMRASLVQAFEGRVRAEGIVITKRSRTCKPKNMLMTPTKRKKTSKS